MKKMIKLLSITTLAALMILGLASCEDPVSSPPRQTPKAEDYEIAPHTVTQAYDGTSKAVEIRGKPGTISGGGAITIYYEGTDGTEYPKSTTPPINAGKYKVTFDVAAVPAYNWDAATGLEAGIFTIFDIPVPVLEDFNIPELKFVYDGNGKAVTITPKEGKSQGRITVYYEGIAPTIYPKSPSWPTAPGEYKVTFDVEAMWPNLDNPSGWSEVTGLEAGTMIIYQYDPANQTPVAEDFTITGMGPFTYDGHTKEVTVTPKEGKSPGSVWVSYKNTDGVTDWPTDAGVYTVTIIVESAEGWNPAYDLEVGELTINPATPSAEDYTVNGTGTFTYNGNARAVSVTFEGYYKQYGEATVYYEGVTPTIYTKAAAAPVNAGKYKVTLNVAASKNNTEAEIEAGELIINRAVPVGNDFYLTGLNQFYDGSPKVVTVAHGEGKSTGAITVYYQGRTISYPKNTTPPHDTGEYTVTFHVAEDINHEAADISYKDNGYYHFEFIMKIEERDPSKQNPVVSHYTVSGLGPLSYDGSQKTVTITANEGKSPGAITVYYEGTSGTEYPKSETPPTNTGKYEISFDVEAAENWNVARGFAAGTLTINRAVPVKEDYTIEGLEQTWDGNPRTITITPNESKITGAVTVYYQGRTIAYLKSETAPRNLGTYTVTFDIAATENYTAATNLQAGILVIKRDYPILAEDYTIEGLGQQPWNNLSKAVTFSAKDTGSGAVTAVYYEGTGRTVYPKSETAPRKTGTYAVTVDVAASNYNAGASGLEAGILNITFSVNSVSTARTTMVVREDGTIWGWGGNHPYQLVIDRSPYVTTEPVLHPTQIGNDTDWAAVSVRGLSVLAIKTDGTLWAWGEGYGATESVRSIVKIGSDTDWAGFRTDNPYFAIKTDGTLWEFDYNVNNIIDHAHIIANGTDWEAVYVGSLSNYGAIFYLAIKTDGTLWGWGWNSEGVILGDDTAYEFVHTPTQIGNDTDWETISVSGGRIAAIKTDGTLWTWGDNDYGQLGDGTDIDRYTPAQIGNGTDWAAVFSSNYAIKTDGTLWAWGYNHGYLGVGGGEDVIYSPIQVGSDTDWDTILAASTVTFALKKDGTIWTWGLTEHLGMGDYIYWAVESPIIWQP